MVEMPTADELTKLYDEAAASAAERGPKGEKANTVRAVVNLLVDRMKAAGKTELSQAHMRSAVVDALSTKDADGKSTGDYKLDQGHFAGIVAGMFETRKDLATDSVVVLITKPKVKDPAAKKTRKAKADKGTA